MKKNSIIGYFIPETLFHDIYSIIRFKSLCFSLRSFFLEKVPSDREHTEYDYSTMLDMGFNVGFFEVVLIA